MAGKQCCNCHAIIDPPTGRETYCTRCAGDMPVHRVYMRFELVLGVWRVTLKAPGPPLREFRFADDSKIEEMARRGNGLGTLAALQGLEAGLRQGLGGIELRLTNGQLAALRR